MTAHLLANTRMPKVTIEALAFPLMPGIQFRVTLDRVNSDWSRPWPRCS